MTHPIDSTILDGAQVSKTSVRGYMKVRVPVIATAAEVATYNLAPQELILIGARSYVYDAADTSSAHSPPTVVVSLDGRRYKPASFQSPVSTTASRLARFPGTDGAIGQTSALREDTSGRVGIGVDPTESLHISGAIRPGANGSGVSFVLGDGNASRGTGNFYWDAGFGDNTKGHFFRQGTGLATYIELTNGECRLPSGARFSAAFLPTTDNAINFGSGSFRLATIFAGTGTINTSDQRDKVDRELLDADTAWALVDAIEPFWYRFVDGSVEEREEAIEGEFVERAKMETVEVDEEAIEIRDGKAHRVVRRRTVTRPVMHDFPLFDANGEPFMVAGPDGTAVQATVRENVTERVPKTRKVRVILAEGRRWHLGVLAQQLQAALAAAGMDPADCAIWGLVDPADPQSKQWIRYEHFHAVWLACLKSLRADMTDVKARLSALEAA